MKNIFKKIGFISLILFSQIANAGLPPTTSKANGDSANVVTFNFQLPEFAPTRTGVTTSFSLLSVNSNVGSFGSSTAIPNFTVTAQGRLTAAGTNAVIAPAGTLTGATLASGVTASSLTSLGTQAQALNMGSHLINAVTDPASAQDAATRNYVDTQLAQLNPAAAVFSASTANIAGSYVNAVSGICIGDTFTTTATTAFALDGQSPSIGARVLLKDQTSSFQDGVWTLTTQAVGGVSGAVLTRALDYDSTADFNAGQIIPVETGTANVGTSWYQTAVVTTCNSSSQTYTQFSKPPSAYLQVANNLSDLGTRQTALNTILGAVTNRAFARCDGSNCSVAAIQAADVPTLNQNTSGTAADLSATLSVAHGGTGLGTLTLNNVILGNGTSTPQFVAPGTSGNVLSSDGTTWSSSAPTGATVYDDVFSGDNSTTAFTLAHAPLALNATQVYISGVYQPKSTYTISSTTLTFGAAPPTGTSNIEVVSGTTSVFGSTPYNVTSQSGNYGAVVNDFVKCDATSAGFTVTLPTAVGKSGQPITIQKTDSTFNVVTINTTSAQTMNGAASGAKHASTQWETIVFISDGSNWLIKSRSYPQSPVSLTITPSAGFGSPVSATSYLWHRRGAYMHIDGRWVNVSVAGSVASADLPSGIAINASGLSSAASGFPIGHWYGVSSGASNILSLNFSGAVIFDGSTTGTFYFSASYVSGAYVKSNGSVVGVSSQPFEWYVDFPVTNWDE